MPSRFEWPFRFFSLLVSMLHIYTVQVLLKKNNWRQGGSVTQVMFEALKTAEDREAESSMTELLKEIAHSLMAVVWNTEVFVVFLPPLFGPQTLAECLQSLGWTSLKLLFISCMPILIILNYFTYQENKNNHNTKLFASMNCFGLSKMKEKGMSNWKFVWYLISFCFIICHGCTHVYLCLAKAF